MVIDAYFDNVVLYNVFYKMDVKVGEKFTLVMDLPGEMDDVYVNRDAVLSHEHSGTDVRIEALTVGVSKIRIMKDVAIVRELLINVVNSIQRPATSLGVEFGQPQPK